MPESIAKTLGAQSNSTFEITLAVAGLEDGTLESESLDVKATVGLEEFCENY
jgi:hypothetical protein